MLLQLGQVERSPGSRVVTQGPGKGALSLRQLQATVRGVQVRSTARCGSSQIRYDGRSAVSPESNGDPQQLCFGYSFTTTDTGPDRARGRKFVVGSHQQVSLAVRSLSDEPAR